MYTFFSLGYVHTEKNKTELTNQIAYNVKTELSHLFETT
jgi:hypothetical protein